MIGQYPTAFKSAAVRNPVCNIAAMASCTDIPDWCYFEAGLPYSSKPPSLPTAEHYAQMFNASPIRYLGQVQTPLLMLLGGADKRVPIPQAQDYAKLLKSRGVKTR